MSNDYIPPHGKRFGAHGQSTTGLSPDPDHKADLPLFTEYDGKTGAIISCGSDPTFSRPERGNIKIFWGAALDPSEWAFDPLTGQVHQRHPTADELGMTLQLAKDQTLENVIAYLNCHSTAARGLVPDEEKLHYAEKLAAARAYDSELKKGPKATALQREMITIEAALKGEPVATTIEKIIANDEAARLMGTIVTGVRRKAKALIAEAETVEQLEEINAAMRKLFDDIRRAPVTFARNPSAWLAKKK